MPPRRCPLMQKHRRTFHHPLVSSMARPMPGITPHHSIQSLHAPGPMHRQHLSRPRREAQRHNSTPCSRPSPPPSRHCQFIQHDIRRRSKFRTLPGVIGSLNTRSAIAASAPEIPATHRPQRRLPNPSTMVSKRSPPSADPQSDNSDQLSRRWSHNRVPSPRCVDMPRLSHKNSLNARRAFLLSKNYFSRFSYQIHNFEIFVAHLTR